MLDKIAAWLNGHTEDANDATTTNGDSLRAIIENVFKAIVELLNSLGEWPIDFE